MSEQTREVIQRKAAEIREKIKDGKIYGEPVKEDDIDTIIVAAYFLGLSDGQPDKFFWQQQAA